MPVIRSVLTRGLLFVGLLAFGVTAYAADMWNDDFTGNPEKRWRFFADTVMGGVSSGRLTFDTENGVSFAQMAGDVSTENRGGFIQFRTELPSSPSADVKGVKIVVKGNGERYFVHLRTTGTLLPWQYYQSGFNTNGEWREVRLPLDSFSPSGSLLRATPKANSIRTAGIVAYGRDHKADIKVRQVGFY
jgi:hypothetical protein